MHARYRQPLDGLPEASAADVHSFDIEIVRERPLDQFTLPMSSPCTQDSGERKNRKAEHGEQNLNWAETIFGRQRCGEQKQAKQGKQHLRYDWPDPQSHEEKGSAEKLAKGRLRDH
jgi:hypothetical protein